MTIEQRAAKVRSKLLIKKPLTGGELANRIGFEKGQAISRAIGLLKQRGQIRVIPGRRPKYLAA